MLSLVPSNIRNYSSSSFVNLGYNFLFKNILNNIKKGQLIVEIEDEHYPEQCTKENPLIFGNINSDYEFENVTVILKVKNLYSFLTKVLFGHDVGFGESYVLGDFVVNNLKDLIKVFIFNFDALYKNKSIFLTFLNDNLNSIGYFLYNLTVDKSRDSIKTHYNIGNEMYELMLGKSMAYSSALFKNQNEDLYDAQMRKFHSLIEKSNISKNHHVLEIGCGWGTFLIETVKKTGCRATGISLSEEQVKYGRELIKKEGLDHLIDLQVCHYKDVKGKYDRIVSIEMMEHIGSENHGEFFKIVDGLLKENGLFIFQVITYKDKDFETNKMSKNVGFISKYIFLGGELSSVTTIVNAATEHSTLELQSAESIGPHYSWTLDEWNNNLLKNQDRIKQLGFDDQFIRMFEYYLNYCSAGFETRYINDFQFVYFRPMNTFSLPIKYYK